MRLVIISNMAHYRRAGQIVGHGATAREIDALAALFDSVRHVACLHDEEAPASALAYDAPNVELAPVPPAGGNRATDKLAILRLAPHYIGTIQRELRDADAVHVRCPANVSLFGLLALSASRLPTRRWVKYAGNWRPVRGEPLSYKLQRLWLERPFHGAQVTINGRWSGQPAHVHSFLNPCLTTAELSAGQVAAASKRLEAPIRLLFAGHLGAAKNPGVALETLAILRERRIAAHLDVAGGGDARNELDALIERARLTAYVTLHGPLPRQQLDALYAATHFVVLPSRTEGWPKVLSEGMAYGAIPIATAVGSIPDLLQSIGTGCAIAAADATLFADAIERYIRTPGTWYREIEAGLVGAHRFSFATYQDAVRRLFDL
jgi:glycosyltransferase involved in cell wall biosynthesis